MRKIMNWVLAATFARRHLYLRRQCIYVVFC